MEYNYMYLRYPLSLEGGKMARLVEQTCQRVYQYEPWYRLDTPSCSYKSYMQRFDPLHE